LHAVLKYICCPPRSPPYKHTQITHTRISTKSHADCNVMIHISHCKYRVRVCVCVRVWRFACSYQATHTNRERLRERESEREREKRERER